MARQFREMLRLEMSTDGSTWEQVQLPANSLPFHQCVNIGEYQEEVGGVVTMYRQAYT